MASSTSGPKVEADPIPPEEPGQIDRIAELTGLLLERRYRGKPRFLRGVHPKDHGCVEATFTVCEDIRPDLRVGLFRKAGAEYRAAIRFSNASALVSPDSLDAEPDGTPKKDPDGKLIHAHGSRGMAIKLYDVGGERLVPKDGESTQDFLMINQPVFAFANVEDYQELNEVIFADQEKGDRFFAQRIPKAGTAISDRAKTSFGIVRRIKSLSLQANPPAYQAPPLSPLDNTYFSAAPFLFGKGRVMKFSAKPVNPVTDELGGAIDDPDYLRKAMCERMAAAGGKDVCFDFQVQVRSAEALADKIETEIENMCTLWEDEFVTVARITIPPQDVSAPERQKFCETLFYTPWHGLADHRPLGGINRMRRKVYEVSADLRACPVSPNLPPVKGKGGAKGDKPGGGMGLGGAAGKVVGGKGFGGKPK